MEEVVKHLQSGDITAMELEKIRDKREQMKQLCDAALNTKEQWFDFNETLKAKLKELKAYKQQHHYLEHLCHTIGTEMEGKTVSVLFPICKLLYVLYLV